VALAGLRPLADVLADFTSADPEDVLRGLRELTNDGEDLPPLIAKVLAALECGDGVTAMEGVREIMNDPDLVGQIFP
jgi:hypothetical protein